MSKLIEEIQKLKIQETSKNDAKELDASGKEANKKISDVGFSLIKNMINSGEEVNNSDVMDYLQKADDINDEVDTVVFGLETDDGEIVKVFVAVEDSDDFEKAMAERLGTEDDIEDVIAELAQEFDIVDVEWPDGEDEEKEDKEETPEPETQNSAGEESTEAEFELNFDEPEIKENTEEIMATLGESFKNRVLGEIITEAKIKDEDWPKEIASFAKTLTTPGQESVLYLITLFGLPKEVIGSKKALGQFRKNIIAAGREFQKNQTLKLWINKLVKELAPKKSDDEKDIALKAKMAEAITTEKEPKDDLAVEWDDPKLMKAAKFRDTLPRGVPRLVYDVLLALGLPAVMLTDINKTKVRETMREFTHLTKRNSRIRIYLNLIAEAMGIKKDDQQEIAAHIVKEESLIEAIQNPYGEKVKEVLTKLGVGSVQLGYKKSQLEKALLQRRSQLNYVSVMNKIDKFLEQFAKLEHVKTEEIDGEKDYIQTVKRLASILGLPADNIAYRENVLDRDLKARKTQINAASTVTRINRLIELVKQNEITQESVVQESVASQLKNKIRSNMGLEVVVDQTPIVEAKKEKEELDDEVDKILSKEKKSAKKSTRPEGADVGKWNFAALGANGGLTLKAKGVTIKLPMESAEKVAVAIGDAKPATVKTSTGTRVIFSPRDRGQTYIIAGLDNFENGVKLSKEDVEKFLDSLTGL